MEEREPHLSTSFDRQFVFSVLANVSLSTSTFNLGGVNPLTLERVYKECWQWVQEITSEFDLFSEPGHKSVFIINPPDFATIRGVDANGIQVVSQAAFLHGCTMDDRPFKRSIRRSKIDQTVSIDIAHRNSTQTQSVVVGQDDTGITQELLWICLMRIQFTSIFSQE